MKIFETVKFKTRIMCIVLLLSLFATGVIAQESSPFIYLAGAPSTAKVGDEITANITITNFHNLQGITVVLLYDDEMIEIMDNDLNANGINIKALSGIGTALDNRVDVNLGAISRIYFTGFPGYNPIQSGPFELAQIKFKVRKLGRTSFFFGSELSLNDRNQVMYTDSNGKAIVSIPVGLDFTITGVIDDIFNVGEQQDYIPPFISIIGPDKGTMNPLSQNPDYRVANYEYQINEDGKADFFILNSTGVVVRTLGSGLAISGTLQNPVRDIFWDGRSGAGGLLQDGDFFLQITGWDGSGNRSAPVKSASVKIDTKAPVLSLVEVENLTFSPNDDGELETINMTVKSEPGAVINAYVYKNESLINQYVDKRIMPVEILELAWDGTDEAGIVQDGEYKIVIVASDAIGNESIVTIDKLIIDTGKPIISSPTPPIVAWTGTPEISFVINESGNSSGMFENIAYIRIDGGPSIPVQNISSSLFSYTPQTPLETGEHTVVVRAADNALNIAGLEWTFTVETIPDVRILLDDSTTVLNPDSGNAILKVTSDKCVVMEPAVFQNDTFVRQLTSVQIQSGQTVDVVWDGRWTDNVVHNGVHKIKLNGKDCVYNQSFPFVTGAVTVDTVAPVVVLESVAPTAPGTVVSPGGAAPFDAVSARFRFSDNFAASGLVDVSVADAAGTVVRTLLSGVVLNAGASLDVSWDGTLAGGAAAADGAYALLISVKDDALNVGSARVPVVVDAAGPAFSYLTPGGGADAGSFSPVVGLKISDARGVNASSISFSIDGISIPVTGAPGAASFDAATGFLSYAASFDPALMVNAHTVTVSAADAAGNVSSTSWTFAIDATPPATVAFASPADGAAVTGVVDVQVRVYDNIGGLGIARTEFFVDGGTTPVGTSTAAPVAQFPLNTAPLSEGPHTIAATAYDKLGNARTESITVYVDNTAPVVSSIAASNSGAFSPLGNSDMMTVSVTPEITETSAYVWALEVGLGDKSLGTWAESFFATQSVNAGGAPAGIAWDGRTAGGSFAGENVYTYLVSATDAAGLVSAPFAGQLTLDNTSPMVALLQPEPGDVVGADVTFVADVTDNLAAANALVVEAVLAPVGGGAERRVALALNQLTNRFEGVWTTGVADDGAYALVIEARDAAGNTARSAEAEITVSNAPASITNVVDAPDPFAPDAATGNSLLTSTEFRFKVTTAAPVRVDWRLEVGDDAGGAFTVLKTFSGSVPLQPGVRRHDVGPIAWDGTKYAGGAVLPDGNYKYRIIADTYDSNDYLIASAEHTGGAIALDSTPPVLNSVNATPDFFTPAGTLARETTLSATVTETGAFTARAEVVCAAGNSACVAAFGGGAVRLFESKLAVGVVPSFVWDGKPDTAQSAPDGDYTTRWSITDAAGNTSGVLEASVNKDDPPVIALDSEEVAFSPDGDTSKDLMRLDWSADQDGVFTFKIYDSGDNLIETIVEDAAFAGGVTHTVEWDGQDTNGAAYTEGSYRVEITGRDANSRVENPCAAKNGAALLDVTDPQLSPFYPYEDEFTWQRPKIKVEVSDNLSGFGTDPQQAAAAVTFGISDYGGALPAEAVVRSPLALRAVTRASLDLPDGPHELSVSAMDRAGNTGVLGPMRFVSVPPFSDGFDGTGSLDTSKWQIVPIHGGSASATRDNGTLRITHTNSIQDNGAPPPELYGITLAGKGVYDVSRQEVVVELNGFNESGSGDLHAAGVAITEVVEGRFPRKLYLVKSGDDVMAFYEDDISDSAAWTAQTQVSGPADLKIIYEEGRATFYVNGSVLRTVNAPLTNAMVGLVAMSGFSGGGGSSSASNAQNLWTDLAGPKITGVQIAGVENPGSNNVVLNEQHYTLTADGTPWQKHVQGRTFNPLRVGQVGNVDRSLSKLTVGEPAPMSETFEGSGIYTTGSIPAGIYADAQGYETAYLRPYVGNEWFGVLPLDKNNYATNDADYVRLVTNAVTSVALSNADNPSGYAYILAGERYRIEAQTRPGDWKLKAYLLNLETLQSGGSFNDAVIAGPILLTKSNEGQYAAEGVLNGVTDASGRPAAHIVARVIYGPADSENKPSVGSLTVGEPVIRWAEVSNVNRSGAGDIVVGETATLTARARTGIAPLAILVNPDNANFGDSVVLGPFALAESPAGSGMYQGETALIRGFDISGADLTRVKAFVFVPGVTPMPFVYSLNAPDVIPGDGTSPASPEGTVVISGVERQPQPGENVSAAITWTAPEFDSDGGALFDLAGHNVYRVREIEAAGQMASGAGAPALSLVINADGSYNMSATYMEVQGRTYNSGNASGGAAAGWLAPGARDLAQLPFSNSTLILPGSDVHVYTVTLQLTGVLYPAGVYSGTVYAQAPREAVAKWIENLVKLGVAASGSIDAHALAFRAQPDGTFIADTNLELLNNYEYTRITASPVAGNTYQDTYPYGGVLFGHAVAAVDGAGNESLPSPAAFSPLPSMTVVSARMANAPGASPTGYIQAGESLLIETATADADRDTLTAQLANRAALAQGAPLAQALIGNPITLQRDTSDPTVYTSIAPLSVLTDASGNAASELIAILDIDGRENVTADGLLKGGVAPVRAVTITNDTRPESANIRVGEPLSVTAQGNSGLSLAAALMNPNGNATEHGTPLQQPPITLTETPPGSGHYIGETVLTNITDETGQPSDRAIALVTDAMGRIDPAMPSQQSLALLPALDLTGSLSLQPDRIIPGWPLNAACGITNNGGENLHNATISVAVELPGGGRAYTTTQTISLAAGETINGINLSPGPVYLAPGVYNVTMFMDIDGFEQPVQTATLTIVDDSFTGALTAGRTNYLSGENIATTFTIENVFGVAISGVETTLTLRDDTGAEIAAVPGPILDLASGEQTTGALAIAVPPNIAVQGYYRIELTANVDGRQDIIAETSVTILPEQILITGLPFPDSIIRYQEPMFQYSITNRTRDDIFSGIVTGEIHPAGDTDNDLPLGAFTTTIENLLSRDTQNISAVFSPVDAPTTGEHRIVIYYQPDAAAPRLKVYETPITVESCSP